MVYAEYPFKHLTCACLQTLQKDTYVMAKISPKVIFESGLVYAMDPSKPFDP